MRHKKYHASQHMTPACRVVDHVNPFPTPARTISVLQSSCIYIFYPEGNPSETYLTELFPSETNMTKRERERGCSLSVCVCPFMMSIYICKTLNDRGGREGEMREKERDRKREREEEREKERERKRQRRL